MKTTIMNSALYAVDRVVEALDDASERLRRHLRRTAQVPRDHDLDADLDLMETIGGKWHEVADILEPLGLYEDDGAGFDHDAAVAGVKQLAERLEKARGSCEYETERAHRAEALVTRYENCSRRIWKMFDGDPLSDEHPARTWLERLEALIDEGAVGPARLKKQRSKIRAWRTFPWPEALPHDQGLVFADSRRAARCAAWHSARDAGLDPRWIDCRAVRSPEHDTLAALFLEPGRPPRCLSLNYVLAVAERAERANAPAPRSSAQGEP